MLENGEHPYHSRTNLGSSCNAAQINGDLDHCQYTKLTKLSPILAISAAVRKVSYRQFSACGGAQTEISNGICIGTMRNLILVHNEFLSKQKGNKLNRLPNVWSSGLPTEGTALKSRRSNLKHNIARRVTDYVTYWSKITQSLFPVKCLDNLIAKSLASEPEFTKKTLDNSLGIVLAMRWAHRTILSWRNREFVHCWANWAEVAATTFGWQCPTKTKAKEYKSNSNSVSKAGKNYPPWATLFMQSRYWVPLSSYIYCPRARTIFRGSSWKNSVQASLENQ